MTVYVDEAVFMKKNGRVAYAHMTADSIEELHEFAKCIEVKRCWWHSSSKYPHYDINAGKRAVAIEHGAVPLRSVELVPIAKRLYESTKQNRQRRTT